MDDDADSKMLQMDPHQITGRPRITWLNTIQHNLAADKLTLNEAVDLAQNRPLQRLMSMYGAMHS